MEEIGLLDVDSDLHLFCLHYVFLPRVNAALASFKDAWNVHPLSSERNLTPTQLWTMGLIQAPQSNRPLEVRLLYIVTAVGVTII